MTRGSTGLFRQICQEICAGKVNKIKGKCFSTAGVKVPLSNGAGMLEWSCSAAVVEGCRCTGHHPRCKYVSHNGGKVGCCGEVSELFSGGLLD